MACQEYIEVSDEGNEKTIIKLHDLNLILMVEHARSPNIIQVLEQDSEELLYSVRFGDGKSLDGFSFDVSPHHNYLIVKEAVYGQSLDDLYATLYCLKDKSPLPYQEKGKEPKAVKPLFHSHYHLTFTFSADLDEQQVSVSGTQTGDLNRIDVYQFAESATASGSNSLPEAFFYPIVSYPQVALDPQIRQGHLDIYLKDHLVVNDLATIKRRAMVEQFALSDFNAWRALLAASQKLSDETDKKHWQHSLLCCDAVGSDVAGLQRQLQRSGFTVELLEQSYPEGHFTLCSILQPFSSEAQHVLPLMMMLSDLTSRFGAVYQGVQLKGEIDSSDRSFEADSLAHYHLLCLSFAQSLLSLEDFRVLASTLLQKHQALDFDCIFSENASDLVYDIRSALNKFDDWEIKEPELRQVAGRLAGQFENL
ncbi:hypothetical protein [Pleionea litopenaei]|uniref:Uncharacterized protein n=1 Tax=Pleionea litopenaei TaxID=3070815 RepID=A0AA51RSG7_9GAMM|nr:hypothetical protein [Pleionea sp. HL-JVS1]WMS86811.1 hypothetical protein Q9312_16445 [Pleionea sp. HL-JVS1]